jgi:hypothetical protein
MKGVYKSSSFIVPEGGAPRPRVRRKLLFTQRAKVSVTASLHTHVRYGAEVPVN